MSAIKSVLIEGNFREGPLNYRPSSHEFSLGAWNISIKTIAYVCEDINVKAHCSISCNFVRGQKSTKNADAVTTYQMPLHLFSIESGYRTVSAGD